MGFFKEFCAALWGGMQAVDNMPPVKSGANPDYDSTKVMAIHFTVKPEGEVEGKIGLDGGWIYSDSAKGAFFKAWPVAINHKVGAEHSILPGVEEMTFYCDAYNTRDRLRIIKISSGGKEHASRVLEMYDALGKACHERPDTAKQLVVYAAIQYTKEIEQIQFSRGNRNSKLASTHTFVMKLIEGFKVVEKGDPEFLNIRRNLDNCSGKEEFKAPSPALTIKTDREIREAFARGEMTQAEAMKALNIKHAAPRTLKDVEKPVSANKADATSAAATSKPAPEPANDNDVDPGFDAGTPPQSAI